MIRRRLTSKQREALYESEAQKAREAGRGEFPLCHHCGLPITGGQMWDAAHDKHKPNWLGGEIAGCAHSRCNRLHNHQMDTPRFAKAERQRKRHLDFTRSRSPLPGGRDDQIKKTMRGLVVDRATGLPWSTRR